MSDGEDQDKDSKTEDPSQKRLDDALEKGQVPNSKEVNSFFMFLMFTMVFVWILPSSMHQLSIKLRFLIENAGNISVDQGMLYDLLPLYTKRTLIYISPILFITVFVAIFSSFIQNGTFIFSTEPLNMDLSKLSIIKGFNRIFSMKSFIEFLKGIFKILVIGSFVLLVIYSDIKELTQYQELSIAGIILQLTTMVFHILVLVTIIMAVIAGLDFAYQKYEHFTNLKMTKQEVKEEYKQMEGNPEVKRKLRQLRHAQSKRRINTTVPEATVIITNPEHYAVALKYESGKMRAPVCVAKGLDLIAQKIKEIAGDHRIPIVESPPLARALYKNVEVDQEIPVEHYEEVAKIISYVFTLEQERKAKKNK